MFNVAEYPILINLDPHSQLLVNSFPRATHGFGTYMEIRKESPL